MEKQVIDIQQGGSLTRINAVLSALIRDQGVRVTISKLTKRRSDPQNKYLWFCYGEMLKALPAGWSDEDLHTYFLGEFYGWDTLEGLGKKRLKPKRRSSKLSTVEFAAYVTFLQQQAAERLGIYLPDPE